MLEIDHLMSIVPDLDSAIAAIGRLGFASQKRGVHTGSGTSNAIVMMPGLYWEMLGVHQPLSSNQFLRDAGARPGLFGVALATDDIQRDMAVLKRQGTKSGPVVEYRRDLDVNGVEYTARFSTSAISVDGDLHAFFFFCQHHTPELVWENSAPPHPNGALFITELRIVAVNPALTANALEPMFGAPSLRADGAYILAAGSLTITIRPCEEWDTSQQGATFLDEMLIEVGRLSETAAFLAAVGVKVSRARGVVSVDDPAIGNTTLSFTEQRQSSV